MKPSKIHSNAVIAVQSHKNMLTKARIRTMINAPSAADAAKVLFECGYNQNLINQYPDREDIIIEDERQNTLKTFCGLCGDEHLNACIKLKAQLTAVNEKETYKEIAVQLPHIKNLHIQQYFRAEIDFLNVRTLVKLNREKLPAGYFLSGGTLSAQNCAKRAQAVEDLNEFEKQSHDQLVKLSSEGKDNAFELNMLFNWYILKQQELTAVKLILTGKKLGFSKDEIHESLRGVYEYFK